MNTFFVVLFAIPVHITISIFLPDTVEWWQFLSVGFTSALVSMAAITR